MKFRVGDKVKQLEIPQWGIGTVISVNEVNDIDGVGRSVKVEWCYENYRGCPITDTSLYTEDGKQGKILCLQKITKLHRALE